VKGDYLRDLPVVLFAGREFFWNFYSGKGLFAKKELFGKEL
jgi:hypothetical protein